jgi:hypothetical protein
MFMWTVQQIVFLILNRVPVTFVTDPELIRFTKKGLQARSATASLLIKRNKFMEKK